MFKQTNPKSKLRSVLLYGRPNSGKTSIVDIMLEIFWSAPLKIPINGFVEPVSKSDASKQIVTFDDIDLPKLFTKNNMQTAKNLLAGYGW